MKQVVTLLFIIVLSIAVIMGNIETMIFIIGMVLINIWMEVQE